MAIEHGRIVVRVIMGAGIGFAVVFGWKLYQGQTDLGNYAGLFGGILLTGLMAWALHAPEFVGPGAEELRRRDAELAQTSKDIDAFMATLAAEQAAAASDPAVPNTKGASGAQGSATTEPAKATEEE